MATPEYTNLTNGRKSRGPNRGRGPSQQQQQQQQQQLIQNSTNNSTNKNKNSKKNNNKKTIQQHQNTNHQIEKTPFQPTTSTSYSNIDVSTAAAAASIPQNAEPSSCLRQCCGCKYNPKVEKLEYDYSKDYNGVGSGSTGGGGGATAVDTGKNGKLPRIRQRGEYYIDSYNGETWNCAFGTNEEVST